MAGTTTTGTSIKMTISWERPEYLYSVVNASAAQLHKADELTNSKYIWFVEIVLMLQLVCDIH